MRLHTREAVTLSKTTDARPWLTVLWKVLLVLAAVEALAGAWTLVRGPFTFSIGPVPIKSSDGWKALTIGVWGIAVSAWLRDRLGRQWLDGAAGTLHLWTIGVLVAIQVLFVLPIARP